MTVRASNGDGAWCAHKQLEVREEAVADALRDPGPHDLAAVCADCGASVTMTAVQPVRETRSPVAGIEEIDIPVTPVDLGTIDLGEPTMRTFLVERMTRDHIEVTICATTAAAMGGDWHAAAIEVATSQADWSVDETECDVFDKDDLPT